MKCSINKNIINKNINHTSQSKGFEAVDITPEELADYVGQGFAFSFQFKKNYRKAENFIGSDIIAADMDCGMTMEEALANEYIRANVSFIYTTPSHTAEKNRFRLVFQLPRTITDKGELRAAQQGLTRKFPADRAAVDAARQFYGSKGAEIHIIGKTISPENLTELIELGKAPHNLLDSDKRKKKGISYPAQRSSLFIDKDTLIRLASGGTKTIADIPESTSVFCPFHEDKNPSAFTTRSKKDHLGVHCKSCQQTFWLRGMSSNEYDFYAFDKFVVEQNSNFVPGVYSDEDDPIECFEENNNHVFSSRYLIDDYGPERIKIGTTLIKSPKGSGKTQYLKKLISQLKQKRLRILLIGHRRTLIKALANDLNLELYLDERDRPKQGAAGEHYAISVDSMSTRLEPARDKFDVVLLDEAEQVFSQLISDTMSVAQKRKSYQFFQHYLRYARHVVMLDADLNQITQEVCRQFHVHHVDTRQTFVLNQWTSSGRVIEMYNSENHLVGEMLSMIEDKKKLFVCCNSKTKADILEKAVRHKFQDEVKLFLLTSENSGTQEATHFIQNIKNEILEYQVVIVSPVIGSGIDITFDDDIPHVDCVVGFFVARIFTHNEIDQQISRVRNPKSVKVWMTPETFNFETEVEPIKQELVLSNVIPNGVKGYSRSGTPQLDLDGDYLTLYATILASQRASKNNLKKNFIDLKKYNGWEVRHIDPDVDSIAAGKAVLNSGKEIAGADYVKAMMAAKEIDSYGLEHLMDKRKRGSLSDHEQSSVDKYFMHEFYHQEVTPALIDLDDKGHFRSKLKMYRDLFSDEQVYGAEVELLRAILQAANLIDLYGKINPTTAITKETLREFAQFCDANKSRVNRVLGLDIRYDIQINPIRQLNMFLRLCGLKLANVGTKSEGKKKIYCYRIDATAQKLMDNWKNEISKDILVAA